MPTRQPEPRICCGKSLVGIESGTWPICSKPHLRGLGSNRVFVFMKEVFVQFLPGTQAEVFDLNIPPRFMTGQAGHRFGQIANPDRLALMEYMELAASSPCCSLQNQGHRFGNRHEITGNIRMGHSYLTTRSNLAAT